MVCQPNTDDRDEGRQCCLCIGRRGEGEERSLVVHLYKNCSQNLIRGDAVVPRFPSKLTCSILISWKIRPLELTGLWARGPLFQIKRKHRCCTGDDACVNLAWKAVGSRLMISCGAGSRLSCWMSSIIVPWIIIFGSFARPPPPRLHLRVSPLSQL